MRALPLAQLPTPVERAPNLSQALGVEVWVKRDDLTHPLYGGNKVRKLGHLLADAQERGARKVITGGALGTNHGLATALHARSLGLEPVLVLTPQPMDAAVERRLALFDRLGIRTVRIESYKVFTRTVLDLMDRETVFIPQGGSSAVGCAGFVEAGLELGQQVQAGLLPEPSAVYVAVGTGGTYVGLQLGLRLAGLSVPVMGVRVTDPQFLGDSHLAHLADWTARWGGWRVDAALDPVRGDQLGAGYGESTPMAEEAVRLAALDGLTLETTYTGKALAALVQDARSHRTGRAPLFWHTYSSAERVEGGQP